MSGTGRDSCGRAGYEGGYEGVETSVVLSNTADTLPSGVRGLGVSVPVLGDPTLRLRGLSAFPVGEMGLRARCADGVERCDAGGVIGDMAANEEGEGFHDERWKLFFLRTLALYAARIAAVASFVMLNTLPAVEGTFDTTLGARE